MISFIEKTDVMDVNSLTEIAPNLYINLEDKERLPFLNKGTILYYKANDAFYKFKLKDGYSALIWKSPEAFLDGIRDYIQEYFNLNFNT